ncbi:MAG: thioredoxin [Candidatus Buchananbacteria bacterium]|nr:thioredoxin [Candidatus Buchananbacteria bacterium]
MSELKFDDQNFNQEVLSGGVALVDFYADWCGPCRMQGPIVEKLAEEYKDKDVKIGKLDVDNSPMTAQKYQVMSIPTIIIFKDGNPAETLVGVQDKNVLAQKLDSLMTA